MTVPFNRRRFLAGAFTAPWLASQAAVGTDGEIRRPDPRLDIHVHLFGVGEGGTGCRMSKAITEGFQFRFLVSALALRQKEKTLDEQYEIVLAEQVTGSGLTAAAILGQDAVYDHRGQPDWTRTSFYVPNKYVFEVVARHTEIMIPCPSINPDRADALDELARCHEKGARLFKIHRCNDLKRPPSSTN